MSWEENVAAFVAKYSVVRMNGKVSADGTQDRDKAIMMASFRRWHELGYKLTTPESIREEHIEALVHRWWDEDHAPKTMQNDLSRIRTMLVKSGKRKSMVKSVKHYLPHVDPKLLVVKTVASRSKSVAEASINVAELLKAADDIDRRFGMMLRLQLAFGLRVKEALHTNPSAATIDDNAYRLYEGETKGNRVRFIRRLTQEQENVLKFVASHLEPGEFLRWPYRPNGKHSDYKWARRRYYELAARIGLTMNKSGIVPHGLRAQFTENMALHTGFTPATLGGKSDQVPKEVRKLLEGGIKEDLGHSFHRRDITSPYYGSFGRLVKPTDPDYLQRCIEEGIRHLKETNAVEYAPRERLPDCVMMLTELATQYINVTVSEVHTLWKRHSQYRIGCEWAQPVRDVVVRSLAVEATRHLRREARESKDEKKGEGKSNGTEKDGDGDAEVTC